MEARIRSVDLDDRWKLADPAILRAGLGISMEEIMDAIDGGIVPFAFDLRANGSKRAMVRVWHPHALDLLKSRGVSFGSTLSVEAVLQLAVPKRAVRSSELEIWWGVGHQHVSRLLATGSLTPMVGSRAKAGPNSYRMIAASEIRRFLATRLMGPASAAIRSARRPQERLGAMIGHQDTPHATKTPPTLRRSAAKPPIPAAQHSKPC